MDIGNVQNNNYEGKGGWWKKGKDKGNKGEKGKGKTKYGSGLPKGKSKGKGKGKELPKTGKGSKYCANCKTTTHNADECWHKARGVRHYTVYDNGEWYEEGHNWDDYDQWYAADDPDSGLNEPNQNQKVLEVQNGGASSSNTPATLTTSALFTGNTIREKKGVTFQEMAITTKHYIQSVDFNRRRQERLMIDSGAQCCVCPKDYAP